MSQFFEKVGEALGRWFERLGFVSGTMFVVIVIFALTIALIVAKHW